MRATGFAISIFSLLAAVSQLNAAPIVRTDYDTTGATNAGAAFALWQTDVGGVFTTDNLNALGGTPAVLTTGANTFTAVGSELRVNSPGDILPAIQGITMEVHKIDPAGGGVTWTSTSSFDSFGFFIADNDGGTVTITFDDGTAQMFTIPQDNAIVNGQNLFWGISGLANPINTVTILTTDPGGFSDWDNFVYANSSAVDDTPVPEPASMAVWGLAAAVGLAYRRRRK